jgi:hypothetical protein
VGSRRIIQSSAITVLFLLSLPHPAWATSADGRHSSAQPEDCTEVNDRGDDGHDAGERDQSHEHEGGDHSEPSQGVDDCVLVPPAEVPEASNALLLSTSAALTGGAGVLLVRRRSGSDRTSRA